MHISLLYLNVWSTNVCLKSKCSGETIMYNMKTFTLFTCVSWPGRDTYVMYHSIHGRDT